MCSIMGYTGRDIPRSRLETAFAATKSRGPDDSRSVQLPSGTLLFHRLAVMGPEPAGMQPFTAPDGSAVVCNGELYGFRELKRKLEAKGYRFVSGSDCELLLPLWRERGAEMFAELDAEFALVLYDAPHRQLHRRPGPHRHPAAVLRVQRKRAHPFRQRAQEPAGPDRQDHALSAGTLLSKRRFRPLSGHVPGGAGL